VASGFAVWGFAFKFYQPNHFDNYYFMYIFCGFISKHFIYNISRITHMQFANPIIFCGLKTSANPQVHKFSSYKYKLKMLTLKFKDCIKASGKNLSTLNCVLSTKRRKITKPPPFAHAPASINQALLRVHLLQSIRPIWACAHFNQLGNMLTAQHPPPLHGLGLLPPPLCAQLTTSHTLSSRQGPTHPHPF
jgi:hypothetical protein